MICGLFCFGTVVLLICSLMSVSFRGGIVDMLSVYVCLLFAVGLLFCFLLIRDCLFLFWFGWVILCLVF